MGLAVSPGRVRPSKRALSYALAVFLPAIATWITHRVAAFHAGPYALHFITMILVAMMGGIWPAVVSIFFSVVDLHYPFAPVSQWWPVAPIEIVRPATLLASALVINWMMKRSRETSEALEAVLAKLQYQTAAMVESQQASKCASWSYDSRDRTRWVPGGYEVFGRPFEEIERRPSLLELIFPEDREMVGNAIAKMIEQGAPLHIEYRTLWPNGELHWSEARGNPQPGDPHIWRGLTFDITERKLAEAALIRSEKLAAMGRLASTVAHEVNNPLESVTNLLYLARDDKALSGETKAYLAMAEKELARLGNITRLTLGFVRTTGVREGVTVADLVEDVLSIFHHRLEMRSIRLDRHYERDVRIDIAPHELRQILINLIANASDALSNDGARLSVRVEREGELAVLLVEDNGSGIGKEHLGRIFEPFFTTKEDVGTGIGLWVTRDLVEKNGGNITVVSGDLPDGLKTSFRIEFPATAAPVAQAAVRPSSPVPSPAAS